MTLLLAWGMCYWTHCDIHVVGVCVIRPTVTLLLAWGMCYWTHCDIHVVGVCVIRPTVIYNVITGIG